MNKFIPLIDILSVGPDQIIYVGVIRVTCPWVQMKFLYQAVCLFNSSTESKAHNVNLQYSNGSPSIRPSASSSSLSLSTLSNVNTSLDQILCAVSLEQVFEQIGSTLWCPWEPKAPIYILILNRENGVRRIFDRILVKHKGNDGRDKSRTRPVSGPDQTILFGVTCRHLWATKNCWQKIYL